MGFDRNLDLILQDSKNCKDCEIIHTINEEKIKRDIEIKGHFCKQHQNLYSRWKKGLRD
jgi:hypothetical protein